MLGVMLMVGGGVVPTGIGRLMVAVMVAVPASSAMVEDDGAKVIVFSLAAMATV